MDPPMKQRVGEMTAKRESVQLTLTSRTTPNDDLLRINPMSFSTSKRPFESPNAVLNFVFHLHIKVAPVVHRNDPSRNTAARHSTRPILCIQVTGKPAATMAENNHWQKLALVAWRLIRSDCWSIWDLQITLAGWSIVYSKTTKNKTYVKQPLVVEAICLLPESKSHSQLVVSPRPFLLVTMGLPPCASQAWKEHNDQYMDSL